MQLFLDCWEPLATDNALPEGKTAHGAHSVVAGPGIFASVLWKIGGLYFLVRPCLLLLFFVVCLASVCFTILLQCLPNMRALRDFFLFLFWSHLREMYSETLIGHSPLPVSSASLCGLSSHDSGSLRQCLFLHQADGKYLVSLIYLKPAKQES